jgi:hypothetical protein
MSAAVATSLTGPQLLEAVSQLPPSASKRELCEATGYIRSDKSGKIKLMYNAMLGELLKAKGMDLPTAKTGGGPTPGYATTTLTNGQVVVGRCYAAMLGAEPGDTWSIEVNEDDRSITIALKD